MIHAAGESSTGDLQDGTYAVALAVPDEAALLREARRLRARGVAHVEIREPDLENQMTAIGLRPGRKEDLRRHVSSLALLR